MVKEELLKEIKASKVLGIITPDAMELLFEVLTSSAGELEKYTKKERVVMAKKMEKLAKYYTGLIPLKKSPDAIFIVDAKAENIAATESRKSSIKVVALVNSDTNIKGIDFPIVANDASIPSIKFFVNSIIQSYKSGQMSVPEPKAK